MARIISMNIEEYNEDLEQSSVKTHNNLSKELLHYLVLESGEKSLQEQIEEIESEGETKTSYYQLLIELRTLKQIKKSF